jgi:pyruvate formate lyase activating enzyme
MTPEAIELIAPVLDAANVDLKAFHPESITGGLRRPPEARAGDPPPHEGPGGVRRGDHPDRPGPERRPRELEALAAFLVEDLGPDTPWHISRFHPTYRMTDRPPTPVADPAPGARDRPGGRAEATSTPATCPATGENTFCPGCGEMLIERRGFRVAALRLQAGGCGRCGAAVAGVWE